jgi:hypothetical protein
VASIGNAKASGNTVDRAQFLARGAKGGAALIMAGSVAGAWALPAGADAIPDADLAYARLLVGAELLALDFYTKAIAAKQFGGVATKYLKRAFFNEQEHLASVSGILAGAGQTPASPSDFDFAYPKSTFASKGAIVKLGIELETTMLGAYLGAVAALQTNALKGPLARIAASEAEHLSVVTQLSGGGPIGVSFPDALSIDDVSNVLDAYTS